MAPVEIRDLSKHLGDVAAIKNLSFDVDAGRVTGFLGPNGAGKTTTLRALLGLVRPSSGSATFDGQRYDELDHPSARVGAVLEDASFQVARAATTSGSWPSPASILPSRPTYTALAVLRRLCQPRGAIGRRRRRYAPSPVRFG
jgi:ABC-type dipeptide/oligopeptide/nickel transport system ATPase component